jgi:predicted NBD/HSP70 family sugar kinase
MMFISILTRRLKKGKKYEDFRKAWYHTVGYGMPTKLYSAINVFDPREIIVVGLGEIKSGQDPMQMIQIEVKERLEHPLEAVIEPEIGRTFGIVVSEDDFSPAGEMKFRPASVRGKETDFEEIAQGLKMAQKLFALAAAERDSAKKIRQGRKRQ